MNLRGKARATAHACAHAPNTGLRPLRPGGLSAPRRLHTGRCGALAGARPVGEEAQLLYAALAQAVLAHHAARSASTFVPRFSLARFRLATLRRSSLPWSIGALPAGSSGATATCRQGRRSASRALFHRFFAGRRLFLLLCRVGQEFKSSVLAKAALRVAGESIRETRGQAIKRVAPQLKMSAARQAR